MSQGYVHVYTGDGKGKTTAALGLAMRAVGAGHRVFLAQFGKAPGSSELRAFARFGDQVLIRQINMPLRLPHRAPHTAGVCCAELDEIESAVRDGRYDLVILDEASIAILFGLITLDWLMEVVESKAPALELVITGRGADERLLHRADLVTEMREVKHYYRQGVLARAGVDM